jgi:hypothetical protein
VISDVGTRGSGSRAASEIVLRDQEEQKAGSWGQRGQEKLQRLQGQDSNEGAYIAPGVQAGGPRMEIMHLI